MSNRTYSREELVSVLDGFGIKDPTDVSRYGSGHINDTFKVETASGTRYILQRVTDAFDKDVLKANILRVTGHLKAKGVKDRLRLFPLGELVGIASTVTSVAVHTLL